MKCSLYSDSMEERCFDFGVPTIVCYAFNLSFSHMLQKNPVLVKHVFIQTRNNEQAGR
jgi:hypothetical protein